MYSSYWLKHTPDQTRPDPAHVTLGDPTEVYRSHPIHVPSHGPPGSAAPGLVGPTTSLSLSLLPPDCIGKKRLHVVVDAQQRQTGRRRFSTPQSLARAVHDNLS